MPGTKRDESSEEDRVANFGHPDFTIYFPPMNSMEGPEHLSEIKEDCNEGSNHSKSDNAHLTSYISKKTEATTKDMDTVANGEQG